MQLVDKVLYEPYCNDAAREKAEKAKAQFEKIKENPTLMSGSSGGASVPKDVILLLDYSGSMAGAKNKASLQGMRDVYEKCIRAADRVSLVIFNEKCETVLPLVSRQDRHEHILQQLNRYTRPNGGTAFFDALGIAFDMCAHNQAAGINTDKWIIALTDGEDNQSKQHSVESLQVKAFQNPNVSLIIIAVGSFQGRDKLDSLCAKTRFGRVIDVEDKSGVERAISAAFVEIASMMDVGVETYNFSSNQ